MPNKELIVSSIENSIGYIIGADIYGDKFFLCTAFLLENNFIMTARHALSGFPVDRLKFCLHTKEEFVFDCIVESGEQYLSYSSSSSSSSYDMLDYILLKVSHSEKLTGLRFATEEQTCPSNFYIPGYYYDDDNFSFNILSAENSFQGSEGQMVFSYRADTLHGFSGAPLICTSEEGVKVFGMHLKACSKESIFTNERTGLSFFASSRELPGSTLSDILNPSASRSSGSSSAPLNKLSLTLVLDDFNTVIPEFYERQESALRLKGLGQTPQFNSHTYRCLLARWVYKSWDKKIRFHDYGDGFSVKQESTSYIASLASTKVTIEKEDLEKQAKGISIDSENKSVLKLINLFFSPQYWEIYIRTEKDGKREWKSLNYKKQTETKKKVKKDSTTENVSTEVRTIHMGHKLSAVRYWIEGSLPYITDELAAKDERKKNRKLTKKEIKSAKETDKLRYKDRYSKYERAGHLCYGTKIVQDFMSDPANYRFEWGALNSKNGVKEGQTTKYTKKLPPGLKLDSNEKNLISSLVPRKLG